MGVIRYSWEGNIREVITGFSAPKMEAVTGRVAQVLKDMFYGLVMYFCGFCGILAKFDNGKKNIRSASNGGEQEFTDSLAILEIHIMSKLALSGYIVWSCGGFKIGDERFIVR